MLKQISLLIAVVLFIVGCSSSTSENHTEVKKDSFKVEPVAETLVDDSLQLAKTISVKFRQPLRFLNLYSYFLF